MKKSNIHIHTFFCDGEGSPEDFCKAAFARGLVSIGFSAHAPLKKNLGVCTNWHLKEERFDAYKEAVLNCKKEWRGKLDVFLGLEADYVAGFQTPADFGAYGLDYIIGSAHCPVPPQADGFFDGGAFLCVDGSADDWSRLVDVFFNGEVAALVNCYWERLEEMINSGGFDVLAHADLLKKNNKAGVLPSRYLFDEAAPAYTRNFERIAAACAKTGLVVEINTGGLNRGRISETYPSIAFLKVLRAYKIPVAINGDSHNTAHIDGHYEKAVNSALAAGYREIMIFNGRKDGKALWAAECLP
ncbi:MAG: histidinol-phosphatase [Spirochaetaceae bacterium]|jgi:histidinol-phosphatase (PHP family)|nr:histidinol-phosphatase [Spirochaetaceae bacterium]